MNQLPPQLLALLAPQMRRPTVYGAQPYQMPQMGQDGAQGAQEAIARAQQADAPQTPPPSLAGAPRPGQRPSHGRRILDRILGGQTLTQAQDAADAEEAARARMAKMTALADSLNMTPQERLIFMTDPEAWAKAHATGLETRAIGRDTSVYTPGAESPFQAPPVTPYDRLAVDQARAKADADRAQRAAADAERARHNRQTEGVASDRVGLARAKGSARGRARPGPGRSPPASASGAGVMEAIAAELHRRGKL